MSFLINPLSSSLLDAHMSNIATAIRNIGRVDGERYGLPQAVPKERKMDYLFRDFFMCIFIPYITELAFRVGDWAYVVPNLKKLLRLNELNLKQKGFPHILNNYFLGGLTKPSNLDRVPGLLKGHVIPKMIRKNTAPVEIHDARLLADHMQKVLTPKDYFEESLIKRNLISYADGELVQNQIKKMDDLVDLFKAAREPVTAKEAYGKLSRMADKKGSIAAKRVLNTLKVKESDLARVFKGTSWFSLLKNIFIHGPVKGWQEFSRIRKIASDPLVARIRNSSPEAARKLFIELQGYFNDSAVRRTPFTTRLKSASSERELVKLLKGTKFSTIFRHLFSFRFKEALSHYRERLLFSMPDKISEVVRQDIMLPVVKKSYGVPADVFKIFEDLSLSGVNMRKIVRLIDSGRFWIKLPLSIIFIFLSFGLLANMFDNKYVQPYQREVVKHRGDSQEFIAPGLLGVIPGLALFGILMKTGVFKRFGYVGSYAISGLAGLATYVASTLAMFQYRISQPRKPSQCTRSGPPLDY